MIVFNENMDLFSEVQLLVWICQLVCFAVFSAGPCSSAANFDPLSILDYFHFY